MWIGAGLATANWIVTAAITLIMGFSYRYRINSEEAMLLARFGEEYRTYMARTWKVLPFIH
jgi:protein-S-isoprenylcysteine O-methyltransferase Ste14